MRVTLYLILAGTAVSASAAPGGKELNQAAGLYHQGRYDSALAKLEALKTAGGWKKRDSLSLFQYLGMASAKLGKDSLAVDYFSGLLRLDSLFQFPENEDGGILKDFSQAKILRNMNVTSKNDSAAPASARAIDTGKSTAAAPIATLVATNQSQAPPTIFRPSAPDGAARADASPRFSSTPKKVGFAYGALPLGTGWLLRDKTEHGVALGLLQAGGIILSLYASQVQSTGQNDAYHIETGAEQDRLIRWQWVQRVSLSTAIGAYLFSLIAGAGE